MGVHPETLERLLMDRSLGVLEPDVAELVDDYVARDDGRAGLAREFDAITDVARRSLDDGGRAALPAFPAARIRRVTHVRRMWRIAGGMSALAASIVLGIGMGYLEFGRATPEGGLAHRVESAVAAAAFDVEGAERGAGGFWSVRRFYDRMAGAANGGGAVQWYSPAVRPKLKGAT